jgi:hypothetical protein
VEILDFIVSMQKGRGIRDGEGPEWRKGKGKRGAMKNIIKGALEMDAYAVLHVAVKERRSVTRSSDVSFPPLNLSTLLAPFPELHLRHHVAKDTQSGTMRMSAQNRQDSRRTYQQKSKHKYGRGRALMGGHPSVEHERHVQVNIVSHENHKSSKRASSTG